MQAVRFVPTYWTAMTMLDEIVTLALVASVPVRVKIYLPVAVAGRPGAVGNVAVDFPLAPHPNAGKIIG